MLLSKRLKELRLKNNMTQRELGEKVNVTKVSICCYESGTRCPTLDTLTKIGEVLGVSVSYLMGYDEDVKIKQISDIIACGNINIESCSCVIFITSVFQRNMIKYSERGYRFILQEVGEVSQNISLICESMNLSSCILGGYLDDSINALLDITSPMETIQSVIIIGKSKQHE